MIAVIVAMAMLSKKIQNVQININNRVFQVQRQFRPFLGPRNLVDNFNGSKINQKNIKSSFIIGRPYSVSKLKMSCANNLLWEF
jgi:hypothetical protein